MLALTVAVVQSDGLIVGYAESVSTGDEFSELAWEGIDNRTAKGALEFWACRPDYYYLPEQWFHLGHGSAEARDNLFKCFRFMILNNRLNRPIREWFPRDRRRYGFKDLLALR